MQLQPEELNPSVTARVPGHISRDDRYFRDRFQGMPLEGYTAIFQRMLDHSNIKLLLDCNWSDVKRDLSIDRTFYTGPLDELLDFRFGPLPYRSLRFEYRTFSQTQCQPVGTINYPNDNDFTRTTESKILTGQASPCTTVVEYPIPHQPGKTIAYYPVPREENDFPHMLFAGRLADYQYYNMDQACARALSLADQCQLRPSVFVAE